MRSATTATESSGADAGPLRGSRPASDLTARARIRDAALGLFGKQGVATTTVRAVAEAAGVSPALVIHHFGSKDGLRRECDRFVVEDLLRKNEELAGSDLIGTMRQWLAAPERFRPALDYFTRLLIDDSTAGADLFDQVVTSTSGMIAEGTAAGTMNRTSDELMQAVLVAAYALVPLLLERHIGRVLGTDGLDAQALQRMTVPTLELLTNGLYADDTYLKAAKSALGVE